MPSARAFRREVSSGVSSAKRPLTRSPGLQAGIALNAAYEKGFALLGQSTSFRARTARLQKRLSAALRQGMASGPAGVLAAMVTGDRTHLSKEQRIAVDRMALYATRRVRCGPAEVEVLRTRNGCVARIHAAGQTFVTLSGSAALAAPVQADYLLASPARPDCVKYDAILSLSSDYRWMPVALSSGQLCHSFSRAE